MSEPSRGDADADALLSINIFSAATEISSRTYLRRNKRTAIRFLTMGSSFSSPKTSMHGKSYTEIVESGDDEPEEEMEDGRPPKRRRMHQAGDNSPSSRGDPELDARRPFAHVTSGSMRASMKRNAPTVVAPVSFYGSSKVSSHSGTGSVRLEGVPKHKRSPISSILPQEPYTFQESMRIDLIELVPNPEIEDSDILSFSRGRRVPFDIKCRCIVAIFYGKNDEKPGEVQFKDYVEIIRVSKICRLRVSRGENGTVSRKLILPEPFVFRPETFYVPRKIRRPGNRQFLSGKNYQGTFGFADDYNMHISIDHVDFDKDWPSLAIPPFEEHLVDDDGRPQNLPVSQALHQNTLDNYDLQLFCKTNAFVDSQLSSRAVGIYVCHKNTRQRVPYALKLRVQWGLPTPFTRVSAKISKAGSCSSPVTQPALLPRPTSPFPGPRGTRGLVPESSGDERISRRRSNVATYNLKTLSAQAQGKSARKSNGLRSKSEHRTLDYSGITVKYTFNKTHAGDTGAKRETIIPNLNCPFLCPCSHSSLNELRMHLQTDHSMFRFSLHKKEPRVEFVIDVVRPRSGALSNMDTQRTFQMGKPRTLFDEEAYLTGDDSWARLRQGPQNNGWPEHLMALNNDSSMTSSSQNSRQSSPNTSTDLMDFEYHEPKQAKRKVFIIPKTAKPLYDTTTKQILQPGDEVSDDDGEIDENWLNHRKHDLLEEFIDVAPDEKEYLHRWNIFMVGQHLTSDKFLPQAVVKFAEANKTWLVEAGNHKLEFMRHLESFKLRGVLDNGCIDKCVTILRSEELVTAVMKGNQCNTDLEMAGTEEPAQPSKPRGPMACVCGETPQGPQRTICRGHVSLPPLVHPLYTTTY